MKKIVIGIILFILGAFIIPLTLVLTVVSNLPAEKQFKIPGTAQVTIDEPGRYYLWNNYQTLFEGKSYNRSERLPDGIEIKITDASTGEPFDFTTSLSISSTSGSNSKNSIGYIEVQNAADISIEVAGGNNERIFSFSQSRLLELIGLILACVLLSTVSALSGVGITIWGIISLVRKKT
jgi:hypothetical protein